MIGPERHAIVAIAAHEAQDGEQAHERRDEPARVAVRVDDAARPDTRAKSARQRREVPGRLQQPPARRDAGSRGVVLERLQHTAMQAVHPVERVEVLQLPAGEARGVVQHAPVRAREVVHQEVHALARQVARELVHRHELRMDVRPELLLALRQLAPALGVALRARNGCSASHAYGARSCGSSASSSSRIVVPVRGGPTTNNGASIGSRVDRGTRRPLALQTQPGLQHLQHFGACDHPARACAARTRRRSTPRAVGRSPSIPATRPRRDRRDRSTRAPSPSSSSASRLASRRGSPTTSPNRFKRRTQSGCSSALVMAAPRRTPRCDARSPSRRDCPRPRHPDTRLRSRPRGGPGDR